ncbi:MAG: LysR family transcriptional regulator [Verrucomicrobiales bacterium]|nr:LysR family transcriptional regulator [Verrucomicrobiales bacterium]
MTHLPSPQQLKYFLAVADELNFGRAAKRCFVSQSTISGAINDLESLLGTRLLERTKRRVSLTREGSATAVLARDVMNRLEEVANLAQTLKGPLSGKLRLGVIPTIGPFLLPPVLPKLKQEYPGLNLQLAENLTPILLDEVRAGTLDCAVIALPYSTGDLETAHLFNERFFVAHTKKQAVKIGARGISTAELKMRDVLLLNDGHCLKDQALAACKLVEKEMDVSLQAASLITLLGMVNTHLGVTFVPETAIPVLRKSFPAIQYTRMAEANAVRKVCLCWRPQSYRRADFEHLAKMISKPAKP